MAYTTNALKEDPSPVHLHSIAIGYIDTVGKICPILDYIFIKQREQQKLT